MEKTALPQPLYLLGLNADFMGGAPDSHAAGVDVFR
jgi:hypothetical protein